ncbi:hypothetical protein [Afifella aestuarii]|uniref:hypothetical protein n=1 Tax=Afifella aestuarii TaxID=1909496 RepID=UPI000FE3E5B8|nr:hypothetical protein [Afifella aestuarii]
MSTQKQLDEANEALTAALRDGEDTTSIRSQIKNLEDKLAGEQQAQAAKTRQARQAKETALQEAAQEVALAEQQEIDQGAQVDGLSELLDGEEPAPVVDDPELQTAARGVAQAQHVFDVASERHQEAQAQVAKLQKRLNEKEAREHTLRQARLAGDEDNAAELHALGLDIEGLRELLADARRQAKDRSPAHEQRALTEARQRLEQVRTHATARVLEQRARQAEQVFIHAHAKFVEAAMAAGEKNRFTAFTPSPDLKFIVYGVY